MGNCPNPVRLGEIGEHVRHGSASGQIHDAVLMSAACRTFFVAELGRVGFHGRINENEIAAKGLSACKAIDDASARKRVLNPSMVNRF